MSARGVSTWAIGATLGLIVGLLIRREVDDRQWLTTYMKQGGAL